MSRCALRLADQVIAIAIARVQATAIVFSKHLGIVAVLVDSVVGALAGARLLGSDAFRVVGIARALTVHRMADPLLTAVVGVGFALAVFIRLAQGIALRIIGIKDTPCAQ